MQRLESIKSRLYKPNYENYHIHSSLSNIITPDSAVLKKHYLKRVLELGQETLSSCEHGTSVMFIETYDLAQENNLKFVYCVEAYFVPDRFEKDNRNMHIILMARNHEGLREINEILSEAHDTGYYHKPRIDWSLLEKLTPENVVCSSGCLSGIAKYDAEENVQRLKSMFPHFYLEVGYHLAEPQKEHNRKLIHLSKQYKVPLILGCDSHYIYPNQHEDREAFLLSKGISYEDEVGWFLDFPDIDTVLYRLIEQGVLNDSEIIEAIDNTHIVSAFGKVDFNKDPKVPTIFPNLTQEQKDEMITKIVFDNYEEYKSRYPEIVEPKDSTYRSELQRELQVIYDTKFADYFLLNYYMIKKAEEYGGCLTATGRGSGPGFLVNRFLNFTTIDRIQESIPLLSERFATAERILISRTIPDIDYNMADPEPFIRATRELLGQHNCYYMCALGEYKEKSAFKMFARANNIPFDTANQIVRRLEEYETAVQHWEEYERVDDDEECEIKITDYITNEEHIKIASESHKYIGIYDNIKGHACGLILLNKDLRREFGLTRTRKGLLVANITGKYADKYKYLKNDYLIVSVVDIIDKVFKKAGITNWKHEFPATRIKQEVLDNPEIMKKVYWEENVICVNQVEQKASSEKVKKYKPCSVEELTQFVAAVRPGFSSYFGQFVNREGNDYGVKEFDEILRKGYTDSSYVLFQENAMESLQLAGIPAKDTYDVIKAISKKNIDVISKYKDQFIEGFSKMLMETNNRELKPEDF